MRDLKSGPHILPPTLRDPRAAHSPFPPKKKKDGRLYGYELCSAVGTRPARSRP